MIDIQLLRKDIASVATKLKTRNFDLDIAAFNEMEATRRQLQTETEDMQAKRNTLSKQIGAQKEWSRRIRHHGRSWWHRCQAQGQ